MEIVTSWERKGMEKGRLDGAIEALQAVLLDVLMSRFCVPEESINSRVRAIDSIDGLRNLTHKALTASSLQELGF